MTDTDFERYWITKFSRYLSEIAGEEVRREVMQDSEKPSTSSSHQEIIDWTIDTMNRLDALVDEVKRRDIMTGCACQYPKSDLQEIRRTYDENKDIHLAHRMLQEQFTSFLKDSLKLDDELIEDIINRGWGLAGIKKGNTIIATKIPKSSYLIEYMKETDPRRKRALYCHCPRVRDLLKTRDKRLSTTYCYCGAGFYKDIWEEILQKPVKVKVLETVLKGDDTCQFAIDLPLG